MRGEEFARVRPFMLLAERMGTLISQIAEGRTQTIGIRYYGPLVSEQAEIIASSVVAGVLRPMLSSNVTVSMRARLRPSAVSRSSNRGVRARVPSPTCYR